MCGSFADLQEPTITGSREDTRTGRAGEAAGRWRSRDSTLSRWRGSAGPTLIALRRWCAPFERQARQQTTVSLNGGGVEIV